MTSGINYAQADGIHSLAAAIVFAAIYAPFIPFYLWRSIRNPTFVYFTLTFFCVIRVAAFTIRAILAGSESTGKNLHLFIANQTIYNVGFVGVLYSVNILVLDRQLLDGIKMKNPITLITSNRHLLRIALSTAVVIGIVGAINISSNTQRRHWTGITLRAVGATIYLVAVILLLVHTLFYINAKRNVAETESTEKRSFGRKNGTPIILAIIVLLLIREVFHVATTNSRKEQTNEKLFYLLAALPELLAVILLTAPGLVPSRSELPPTDETGTLIPDFFKNIRRRSGV